MVDDDEEHTLAHELMNMMSSGKENNSDSVNIINEKPKAIIKHETGIKKDRLMNQVDCELILYVDNREKKNQQ